MVDGQLLLSPSSGSAFVGDRQSSQAEKGVAASGGEVCTHDVAAPMLYPCTAQMEVNANFVLWVTVVRGQILS